MHPPPALLIFLSPLPIFQHMDPNPCTVDWVCCPCTKAMLGSGKGGECQLALGHEKTTHIHFPVKLALNKPDVSKHGSTDCTNTPENRVILGRCEQGCARRVKEKATQEGGVLWPPELVLSDGWDAGGSGSEHPQTHPHVPCLAPIQPKSPTGCAGVGITLAGHAPGMVCWSWTFVIRRG